MICRLSLGTCMSEMVFRGCWFGKCWPWDRKHFRSQRLQDLPRAVPLTLLGFGFHWAQVSTSLMAWQVKNHLQRRRHRRCRFDPWVGKIPWRRKQQPAPVFLPGESHGQRSLAGYSSWVLKELDATEQLSVHTHIHTHTHTHTHISE